MKIRSLKVTVEVGVMAEDTPEILSMVYAEDPVDLAKWITGKFIIRQVSVDRTAVMDRISFEAKQVID
jgi:hypothetical protein